MITTHSIIPQIHSDPIAMQWLSLQPSLLCRRELNIVNLAALQILIDIN